MTGRNMWKSLMLPLDEHVDLGFGAIADEYKDAAKCLLKGGVNGNQHLPLIFLMRHSIELYLKSAIIFHNKVLGLCDDKSNYCVYNNREDKLVSFEKMHDVSVLYGYLNDLMSEHREFLSLMTNEDWQMPRDIQSDISKISSLDKGSDFFRYPSKNSNKSGKQKSFSKHVSNLDLPSLNNGEGLKTFLVVENGESLSRVYDLDRAPHESYLPYFENAIKVLDTLHAAMVVRMWEKAGNC